MHRAAIGGILLLLAGAAAQVPQSAGLKVLLKLDSQEAKPSDVSFAGEVLLENTSKQTAVISYQSDPREFLDFIIVDSNRKIVSEAGYGRVFSPFATIQRLEVPPGKTVSLGSVNLYLVMRKKDRRAGNYTVYGVYKADDKVDLTSNAVRFSINSFSGKKNKIKQDKDTFIDDLSSLVEEKGGKVDPVPFPLSGDLTSRSWIIDWSKTRIANRDVECLCEFLRNNTLFEQGTVHVAKDGWIYQVTTLDLSKTEIDDEGLAHVGQLRGLWGLRVAYTNVTRAGLERLTKDRQYFQLDLSGLDVSSKTLKNLGQYRYLTSLVLRKTNVDDDGIRLINARALSHLDLSHSRVTDSALKGQMNPSSLKLAGTRLTDQGLKNIAALRDLKELDVSDTAITDRGLMELYVLTRLRKLDLRRTQVTDEGIAALKDRLRGVEVVR